MIAFANLRRDEGGTAAAELALVAPMLIILMFGATELGRYFWSEHQLIKAVRDASVFVSRQPIDKFNCGASSVDSGIQTKASNLIKTGVLSGGSNRLPNWTAQAASITYTLSCVTSAGGTTLTGIYTANANQVPTVTIDAQLPYNIVLQGYGLKGSYTLRASEQAVVVGA